MKAVPVRTTEVPDPPLDGVKLVMVGAATKVKLAELVPVPPEVVTLTFPVVVPDATIAVIEVELFTVKLLAAVVLNLTAEAPVKLVPVMPTDVPIPPEVGEKLVTVGVAARAMERLKIARQAMKIRMNMRSTTNLPIVRGMECRLSLEYKLSQHE